VADEIGDLLHSVVERLRESYGAEDLGNLPDPLDELIFIVLSTRTRGSVFTATFLRLREAFPEWSRLADVPLEEIEKVLRPTGLELKKATWLQALTRVVLADQGAASLGFLRALSDEEAEDYLTSLPGVGVKTARCVMMYSLGRQVFPLDAHAYRLLRRLGCIPEGVSYRSSHDLAQALVPADLRYDLHVLAVVHGRRTCLPRCPKCDSCSIEPLCSGSYLR
jgi:endonuclease III